MRRSRKHQDRVTFESNRRNLNTYTLICPVLNCCMMLLRFFLSIWEENSTQEKSFIPLQKIMANYHK